MNKSNCNIPDVPKGLSEAEKQRVVRANQAYCEACEENGIKVCSWESFQSWKDYVDGKIDDTQLTESAANDLKEFKNVFQKYTIIHEDEPKVSTEDTIKKERAKLANRIYKKMCNESGLSYCFFKNFGTWSDYVNGNIGDLEFVEKVRLEVGNMGQEASQ
jgi:hypothetical protein